MNPLKLLNTDTTFSFNDKDYTVKKANLEKVILFQERSDLLAKEKSSANDYKLAAYAIALVVGDKDQTVTEQYVLENCPADIDLFQVFATLGFMSQQKMEFAKRIQATLEKLEKETK